MKLGFGILECFFGPAWSVADRRQWAPFMAEHGFKFYLYGPKSDSRLRKNWQEAWPDAYQSELQSLALVFLERSIGFGVALTPLSAQFNRREQALIRPDSRPGLWGPAIGLPINYRRQST